MVIAGRRATPPHGVAGAWALSNHATPTATKITTIATIASTAKNVGRARKLFGGQCVGQTGEVVDLELFTAALRSKVALDKRLRDRRAFERKGEMQAVGERLAPVREGGAHDLPKPADVLERDHGFIAAHEPNDGRVDVRRRIEGAWSECERAL